MKSKKKLSIVISAFNEEDRIEACLQSASFADEVIFIDGTSTDSTVKIARNFTSKVFVRPNNLMLNVNKNFGFTKASGDWILCLDADERVSPELKKEIRSVIDEDNQINGYWISRKNMIFGKWIQHAGWYPDYQMRLFKKGQGKFEERHVHEMVQVAGEKTYLKNHIIHNNYENISQFLYKTTVIYAPNEAKELLRKGYVFNYLDCIRFPAKEFMSRFFAREGYKDGFHGLALSLLMAFYHFVVFCFIWEKQGFEDTQKENITSDIKKEFKGIHKDLMYWFGHEEAKSTKNYFKKNLLKLKNKL